MMLTNKITLKPFWKHDYKHIYPVDKPILSSLRKCRILKSSFQGENDLKFKVKDENIQEQVLQKIKSRKLKLNPTKEQKIKFNQWAGCTRFLYNTTIACLTNPNNKTLKHKYKLRNRFATIKNQDTKKFNSFYNNKPWLKECLSSIRKLSIYEAEANLRSCYTNLKNKNIDHFTAPYKTKKKEQSNGYAYSIEKQDIKKEKDKLFIANIGEIRYFGTKQLHKLLPNPKPDMDCKIQKTAFNEYFLIIPYVCKPKAPKKVFTNPISIDPGVRKVLTTYNPNTKESLILGNRWATSLMNILIPLDKLYGMKSKTKEIKINIKRLRKRIFYLKKEFRDQSSNYLTKNHDLILIPKLDTKQLSQKAFRRLKTKAVRSMLTIGHSKLFDCVKDKCWQNGCYFLHVEESYTSQTCPRCGNLHKTSSETYTCSKCDYSQDRDITGAVNIFLKALMA